MTEAEVELGAALGFAFLAASFAVEPETWPVFLAYASDESGCVKPFEWTREKLSELVGVLQRLMEIERDLPDEDGS